MALKRRFLRRRIARSYKNKFLLKHRQGGPGPRPELKFVDVLDETALTFQPYSGSAISCLNITQEGAGAWNRIGRRINMRSIEVRLVPKLDSSKTTVAGPIIYRIMLVYDAQWNTGSGFSYSLLLQSRQPGGASVSTILSPLNMDNRDRFMVLRDWVWTDPYEPAALNPMASAASDIGSVTENLPREIHWFIKLKGLEAVYGASTGASSDINTGALLLICMSNQATANVPIFMAGTSRLRFYD